MGRLYGVQGELCSKTYKLSQISGKTAIRWFLNLLVCEILRGLVIWLLILTSQSSQFQFSFAQKKPDIWKCNCIQCLILSHFLCSSLCKHYAFSSLLTFQLSLALFFTRLTYSVDYHAILQTEVISFFSHTTKKF